MFFKKILSLLLVICMLLSITACGLSTSRDDDDDNRKKSSQSSKDNRDDEDEDDEDDNKSSGSKSNKDKDKNDEDEDEDEPSNNKNNIDPYKDLKEVNLPKGFPEDIFPIYKGGRILNAGQETRNDLKVYTLWIVFDSKVETVSEYYKKALEEADDFEDKSSFGFVVYSGKMGGYEFTFNLISDATNEKYSVLTMEIIEIPTVDSLLNTLATAEIPDQYPSHLFPIIDGGALSDATESESDGKVSYYMVIYTDKSFKEVIAFYESALGSIEDKGRTLGSDDFQLYGNANGYYFNVWGSLTEENGVQLTRYYLSLTPLSE